MALSVFILSLHGFKVVYLKLERMRRDKKVGMILAEAKNNFLRIIKF